MRRGATHSAARAERGFGLIETMIVVVIVLFMSIVIFTVMSTSEKQKRTTNSVSDADQEGNYAALVLEKAIRSAGSGFRQGMATAYGCPLNVAINGVQWLPMANGVGDLPAVFQQLNTDVKGSYEVAPVLIDYHGSLVQAPRTSDALIVMSGTAGFGEYPVTFVAPPTTTQTTGNLTLTSTAGFNANDMLLILQPTAGGLMSACALSEVAGTGTWPVDAKGLPQNGGVTPLLPLAGDYYTQGSPGISFQLSSLSTTSQVMDLGNELTDGHPNFQLYAVASSANGNTDINDTINTTLWSYDLLQVKATAASTQATSVADGVYEMYAVYGVSANPTCTAPAGCPITSWESPNSPNWNITTLMSKTAAANAALYQIKAIRLALVMRAALPEQQTSAGTPAVPPQTISIFNNLEPAGGSAAPITQTLTGNYRYRTIEITIPVRNNLF
jgi:type IV pilus assembly protein PilW